MAFLKAGENELKVQTHFAPSAYLSLYKHSFKIFSIFVVHIKWTLSLSLCVHEAIRDHHTHSYWMNRDTKWTSLYFQFLQWANMITIATDFYPSAFLFSISGRRRHSFLLLEMKFTFVERFLYWSIWGVHSQKNTNKTTLLNDFISCEIKPIIVLDCSFKF